MTGSNPAILVVDADGVERAAITKMLREAGFAIVTASGRSEARRAVQRRNFAAAVIASSPIDTAELLNEARRGGQSLPALTLTDPADQPFAEDSSAAVIVRPCEPHRLLDRVFALVTQEDRDPTPPRHRQAAELAITAARLACLYRRQASAAAGGMSHLADDLTRQIGEVQALHSGLATPLPDSR